ncbi:hypothetical protein VE03_04241 [Pseudogymnoascus sp. 23342-1-I1]|nr:hypothetical protein VE03_04241 [Pseudogymnoascus sp. 23342-1-I1]
MGFTFKATSATHANPVLQEMMVGIQTGKHGLFPFGAAMKAWEGVMGFVSGLKGSVAAGNPAPDNHSFAVTPSTWNDAAIAEAWSVTSPPFPANAPNAVYSASKAESEKALWAFVEKEKPAFRVNAVLPDANFGPALNPEGGLSTGGWIRGLADGGANVEFVKSLPPGWYVNVVDTAHIHVAALLSKSIRNERIYAAAAPLRGTRSSPSYEACFLRRNS